MQELQDAGLFGDGLVTVNTPEMVRRYNDCLDQMGIEPTSLNTFHIDGIGWSPEISAEKNDPFYLSGGIANLFVIILTPDQKNKPVYFPFHSFVRKMMAEFFRKHESSISDITATHGIWLDIDDGLSDYESPADLLLMNNIVIRSSAGGLLRAANAQKRLVAKFYKDDNWSDVNLRQKMVESAQNYGDLRYRHVEIPETKFELKSFFTRAFGGVFVFRHQGKQEDLLILEDGQAMDDIDLKNAYVISNPDLLARLNQIGLIEIDFDWYKNHPERIESKIEILSAEAICCNNPDIDYISLTSAQKKVKLRQLKDNLPSLYFELEKIEKKLSGGQRIKIKDLSPEARKMLARPASSLPRDISEVVWKLLSKMRPISGFKKYVFDREKFIEEYPTWPLAKRRWAIKMIKDQRGYISKTRQLEDGGEL